jgi:hypothetical protein
LTGEGQQAHNRYMDTNEMLIKAQAIWDAAPTTFADAPFDPFWAVEGPDEYEKDRELSDHEYDLIANNYERNWV